MPFLDFAAKLQGLCPGPSPRKVEFSKVLFQIFLENAASWGLAGLLHGPGPRQVELLKLLF